MNIKKKLNIKYSYLDKEVPLPLEELDTTSEALMQCNTEEELDLLAATFAENEKFNNYTYVGE